MFEYTNIIDLLSITSFAIILKSSDAGSVLKVVSITQENWSTEEVVLEELQVFKVCVSWYRSIEALTDMSQTLQTHLLSLIRLSCHRSRLPSSAWSCLQKRFVVLPTFLLNQSYMVKDLHMSRMFSALLCLFPHFLRAPFPPPVSLSSGQRCQ